MAITGFIQLGEFRCKASDIQAFEAYGECHTGAGKQYKLGIVRRAREKICYFKDKDYYDALIMYLDNVLEVKKL